MKFGGGLGISDLTNGEGSPPSTNKYARRGDMVFIGGGAVLVIGICIVGGLAYFDAFHTSPPKPVAEKPTPPPVVQKPSPPAVAAKPTLVPPSASRSAAAAAAPVELPAVSPAEPASAHAMADNPLKPPESQPKPQPSQQPVVTTDQTPPVVDDKELVDPAARE
jgi:hypothetical protein